MGFCLLLLLDSNDLRDKTSEQPIPHCKSFPPDNRCKRIAQCVLGSCLLCIRSGSPLTPRKNRLLDIRFSSLMRRDSNIPLDMGYKKLVLLGAGNFHQDRRCTVLQNCSKPLLDISCVYLLILHCTCVPVHKLSRNRSDFLLVRTQCLNEKVEIPCDSITL